MNTLPEYFFGGTSRPLMIKLEGGFTYFSLSFGDCTGLSFEGNTQEPFSGMNMRTARELARLAHWITQLHAMAPTLSMGEHLRMSLSIPGFSPEFEEESHHEEDRTIYDATELNLHALWTHGMDDELCLFLEDSSPDNINTSGIPVRFLLAFSDALLRLAASWDNGEIDLRKSQPLAPRKPKRKPLMLAERRAA